MTRLIRQEFYRLKGSFVMLGALAIVLVLGVIIVGKSAPASLIEQGVDFEIVQDYFIENFGHEFEDVEAYTRYAQNLKGFAIIQDTQFVLWIGVLLAGFFIGEDFTDRTIGVAITCGHSRTAIYGAKLIAYFALALLISFGSLFITLGIYASGLPSVSGNLILRLLLSRVLSDTATVSIPFLIAFLCQDLVKTMSLGAGYAMILTHQMGQVQANNTMEEILSYLPAIQLKRLANFGLAELGILSLCVLIVLAAAVALSYHTFRRLELK